MTVDKSAGSLATPGKISLFNVTDQTPVGTLPFAVEEVSSYDGRIYVRTADSVQEVVLTDAGTQIIVSTRAVAQTLPHASRLYPGVVVQRLLGSTYVSLLLRPGAAQQVALKELDAYRIVEAKFDRGVLMIVGEQRGRYDRLVFRFDETGGYDVRTVQDVPLVGLNFVTLDSGVCVCLNEDDKLEVFSGKRGSATIKYVEDAALSGARLARQGGTVLFSKDNRLYRVRMK